MDSLGDIQIISTQTNLKIILFILAFGFIVFLIVTAIETIRRKTNEMIDKIISAINDRPLKNTTVHKADADETEYQDVLRATDDMTGIEFEKWLRFRFCDLGYTVRLTPVTGDGGADLIVVRNDGTHVAVQAKKSRSRNIGVKAIDEVMRGEKVHDCDKTMVVTNQYFTDQAKRDAAKCNVELMDRDGLLDLLKSINNKKFNIG